MTWRVYVLAAGIVVGALGTVTAFADTVPAATRARAVRRTGPIAIDGRLDEGAWAEAPKQTGFTQRFPRDGIKAELETTFAILYDDQALYVGVWASDPQPQQIRRLLTRRDVDVLADAIAVGIDSYHDRRTAYVFQLNAAGVQRDVMLFDDSNQDDTWDAVWSGETSIGGQGWCAEFRIPFNQLRFAGQGTHEWGLQVVRIVARTQEQASWSPWPRSAPEVVSKFGVVEGISQLRPGRRLELLPYVLGGVAAMPVESGDPLNERLTAQRNLGLDLKYGLGSAFTVSATINPDFGQVEADPSQVNLSANELFFAEKRPFFLEGVDLFKLPIGNGDNTVEGQFYSRRIGAAPPEPEVELEYIKAPSSTTIYGAAKLTGKTRGGWSLGILDAVTGQQSATLVDTGGQTMDRVIAPLTNYSIVRIKRDFNEGRTALGLSGTAVNRSLSGTPLVTVLHDQAYTVGLQLKHRWDHSAWQADVHGVGSWVHGSELAIAKTQQSNRHLYQRPDLRGERLDPTRTSLTGAGASWLVGKLGDTKHVRYGFGGDLRTIGLELNDAGFQRSSDQLIPYVWAQYRDDAPGDNVLNWQVSGDVFTVSTFEPRLTDIGFECNAGTQVANYWTLSMGCNLLRSKWAPGALRGGGALRVDPHVNAWANVTTDTRKPVWFSLFGTFGRDWTADAIDGGIELGATIQARSNIDVFIGPTWYARNDPMQYVDEARDSLDRTRYVFAHIKQRTAAMTVRMNWTFSPRFSLQAYAQPFVSSGRYSELKDVDQPGARRFADRFARLDGQWVLADGVYTFRQADGATYSVDRPDFDFRQLRSTVVARWEYRPGSTIFAIWSHGRTSEIEDGRFRLGRDLAGLFDAEAENVVMVKANYWVGL
ncbi:MAG: DUF5916 domain-containing protein [Kofleriaceae bacterium]